MTMRRAALLLGLLAVPAHAQSLLGRSAPGQASPGQASPRQATSAPIPSVLTPLGPVQTPPPSAPTQPMQAPTVVAPSMPIQSEQLPVLTTPPTPEQAPGPPPAASPPATSPSASPAAPPPAAPTPAAPTPAAPAPSAPVPVVSDWVPRAVVVLQALDKVTARNTQLTGRVGDTLHFGSLSIVVKACFAHPPDQPQDFTAYLDITDSHPDAPDFHGWMLADEPSVSIFQHPVYDIRLTACRD
jgi:hypothetical protein